MGRKGSDEPALRFGMSLTNQDTFRSLWPHHTEKREQTQIASQHNPSHKSSHRAIDKQKREEIRRIEGGEAGTRKNKRRTSLQYNPQALQFSSSFRPLLQSGVWVAPQFAHSLLTPPGAVLPTLPGTTLPALLPLEPAATDPPPVDGVDGDV
jgi:hypothetical protein